MKFRVHFADRISIDVVAGSPDEARENSTVQKYMKRERVAITKIKRVKELTQ